MVARSSDTKRIRGKKYIARTEKTAEDSISYWKVECPCKDKCSSGFVDSECLICRVNIESCAGKEVAQTEPAIEPEPDKPEKQQNYLPIVIIILLICGGAAVYFLKLRKNKPEPTAADLDAYDDDEYEETEKDDTE